MKINKPIIALVLNLILVSSGFSTILMYVDTTDVNNIVVTTSGGFSDATYTSTLFGGITLKDFFTTTPSGISVSMSGDFRPPTANGFSYVAGDTSEIVNIGSTDFNIYGNPNLNPNPFIEQNFIAGTTAFYGSSILTGLSGASIHGVGYVGLIRSGSGDFFNPLIQPGLRDGVSIVGEYMIIPEPASYSIMFGCSVFVFIGYRRFRLR